jgi:hypothetical protein
MLVPNSGLLHGSNRRHDRDQVDSVILRDS